MITRNREQLEQYGARLVAAGFRVWYTPVYPDHGYLTYEKDGNYGHLQEDSWGDVSHDMPIVPSREFGSSMFIDKPLDPWTVEAAEQAARPSNWNDVVGTQQNARERTWLSSAAIPLHEEVK